MFRNSKNPFIISLIVSFLIIFSLNFISPGNLSLFPNPGPNEASSIIEYTFNFSTSNNCLPANIILSHNKLVTINSRGFGFVSIDISNLSSIPQRLCEFKEGTYILRKNHSFSDIVFNQIYAVNLNLSGDAIIKGSVNITENITSSYFKGSINWSDVQNFPESFIDVNSSDFWDGLNTPSDIPQGEINHTLDDAYNDGSGTRSIDVDDGNLDINLSNDQFNFNIRLNDADNFLKIFNSSGSLIFRVDRSKSSSIGWRPLADDTYDIGTSISRWRDLFLSGNLTVDTNTLFVDSNSNRVGIGTANPDAPLHIEEAAGGGNEITLLILDAAATSSNNGPVMNFESLPAGGRTIYAQIAGLDEGNFGGRLEFRTRLNTGGAGLVNISTQMVIKEDGNVGIGTTSPSVKLDVRGAINATDWTNVSITEAQVSDLQLYLLNKTNVNLLNINVSSATIHGNLNVTGTSYLGDLIISADNITVNNLLNKSSTGLRIWSNLYINNRLGIGTTNPTELLQIADTDKASDNYLYIGVDGGSLYREGIKLRAHDENFGFTIEHDDRVATLGLNILRHDNDATGKTALFIARGDGSVGIGTTGPNATLEIINSTTQGGFMVSSSSSGAGDLFIVDEAGNVGIGTANPDGKLSIQNVGGSDTVNLLTFSEDDNAEFYFESGFAGTGSTGNFLKLNTLWANNSMVWRGDGNVGIGTNGPLIDLAIGDSDTGFNQSADGVLDFMSNNARVAGLKSDGRFYVLQVDNSAAENPACRESSGEITRGSAGCSTSSIRYKQNIQPLEYGLKEVMQFKPYSYQLKTDPNRIRFSMTAEEVAEILPEIIGYEPDDPTLIQTYDKRDVQAVLIKAIQELKQENDLLKSELCLRDNTYSWC